MTLTGSSGSAPGVHGFMDARWRFALLLLGVVVGCGKDPVSPSSPDAGHDADVDDAAVDGAAPDEFDWELPANFPRPKVPADNPMNTAKVALGRRLFYDTALSIDGTFSCASCHEQAKAFTDGRAQAVGVTGVVNRRSSMSLVNVAYINTLTWANDLIGSLEQQALIPMFGQEPVELGLAGKEGKLLDGLRAQPLYLDLFEEAYPDDPEAIRLVNVTRAIAAFQRTILSSGSPYDRYAYGKDKGAMSASALRGMDLFFGERLECFHCHGGFNFSDSVSHEGTVFREAQFHNTGLYNLDGKGAFPLSDEGLRDVSGRAKDMGRFRAPTLRNIAVTAPYMHDGSIATLDGVIDHYAAGGRTIEDGPNAGIGSDSPLKSAFVNGFLITEQEREDLKAFLNSLTDESLLTNPALSDPWKETP